MTNVGLSSCRIHVKDDARYYADSFNWFALGFQQWGVSVTSNTGPVTITYPIAHTIFACPYTTSAMNFEAAAAINTNNNTVQSFDVHARWNNGSNVAAWVADTFNWFSVGI